MEKRKNLDPFGPANFACRGACGVPAPGAPHVHAGLVCAPGMSHVLEVQVLCGGSRVTSGVTCPWEISVAGGCPQKVWMPHGPSYPTSSLWIILLDNIAKRSSYTLGAANGRRSGLC